MGQWGDSWSFYMGLDLVRGGGGAGDAWHRARERALLHSKPLMLGKNGLQCRSTNLTPRQWQWKCWIPVSSTMPDTCLHYHCRAVDAIRLTLSSQIAVSVCYHHSYRHWLFSSSVSSGDVLITDTNSFCSHIGQVTLPSPTLDSFSSVLWCHHFARHWF
jgi:hypothetical protein